MILSSKLLERELKGRVEADNNVNKTMTERRKKNTLEILDCLSDLCILYETPYNMQIWSF